MRAFFGSRKRRDAQTLVFFLLAWGTIMLLCGLAIDSGLLFLAKAKMGRAVDGAALAAVGNFNRAGIIAGGETQAQANRDSVATIMRNFAVANFTDLSPISSDIPSSGGYGGVAGTFTSPTGVAGTSYTYNFNDGTRDSSNWRRFVQVTLTTGSGGAITSATCNARCPVQTYFIGYGWAFFGGQLTKTGSKLGGYVGPGGLGDLKVSSSAIATRNPRLIMVVIDRSASMLEKGGGASGLPPAVVQFLNFFDTTSDNIGIVSFGSSARLEMPLTTNFLIAGTNNLIDAYETNAAGNAEPGIDPESVTTNVVPAYDPNYATTGIRRLKFGGDTAADDGIRLAIEQLMANPGFNDPNVVKYMVIFTDGKWNASRTLAAAPGYVNEVKVPLQGSTTLFLTNGTAMGMSNGQDPGPWIAGTNIMVNTNLVPVPSLGLMASRSSIPFITNALATPAGIVDFSPNTFNQLLTDHTNDTWQSVDTSGLEPLLNPTPTATPGAYMGVTNTTWVSISTNATGLLTNYYTHNVDVWLQPGSVAYYYSNQVAASANTLTAAYVSDYTKPAKHINLYVDYGGKVDLVVPGYIVDGVLYDGIDLAYPDDQTYPRYRDDNYNQPFMWPDEDYSQSPVPTLNYYQTYLSSSLERQLMFRNYPNLLTGFYVFRADEPIGKGVEPLITEYTNGAPRARWGLGAYYPSAGFYWPFGGDTDNHGYVTNAVGVDVDATYGLPNPNSDPSTANFTARHIAYSINMLSTNAAPEWYGELFYKGAAGATTNNVSGTGSTAASSIMVSSDWQNGAPDFVTTMGGISGLMLSDGTHNTTITPNPSVWRPAAFNGSVFGSFTIGAVSPGVSSTGGWVSDGAGHYYKNTMAWSGRPTHYFDFSQAKWVPILDNHHTSPNREFLQLGNWKAGEYAWHARALGVTIYTVGYGQHVGNDQQVFLAQIANATNTTGYGGSNIAYNPGQPLGQQFYATNATQIEQDFFSVGQAINAALTQ